MPKYQDYWNKVIRTHPDPSKFSAKTMENMVLESGEFWKYEQDPHNTDAYREGWERTFGKKIME